MAEIAAGMSVLRSSGATGCLAMWQWIHSIGSDAVKGRVPLDTWYSVTPSE